MQLSQVILIVIYLCRSLFFTVVLVWHCTAVCVVANMGFMREGPNRGIPRSPPVRSHVAQPRLSESLLSFKLLQWPVLQVLLSYCHYSVKSDRRSDSLWTDGAWPARPLPRSYDVFM